MNTAIDRAIDVVVRVPTVLRKFTGGSLEVTVSGITVGDAIEELSNRFPSLKTHLYDGDGVLRSFVNLYLNEEDIRYLDGVDTRLKSEDRIAVIPAVAGGTERTSHT